MLRRVVWMALALAACSAPKVAAQNLCSTTAQTKVACTLANVYGVNGLTEGGALAPINQHEGVFGTSFLSNLSAVNSSIGAQLGELPLVSPASGISLTVSAGQTLSPFQATLSSTSNTAVNWSANSTATPPGCGGTTNISCGTFQPSNNGVPESTPVTYMAPTTLPFPPSVNIIATSAADTNKSTNPVTVALTLFVQVAANPPTAPPVPVALLSQQAFTATVTGQNGSTVAWSLTQGGNPCSPACGTIDANGTYTAPAAPINPNIVTVVATATANGPGGQPAAFSGTGTITVAVGGAASTPLFGTYVLQYRDYPGGSLSPRVEAGSLVFAANGQIHGVEDDNNGATPTPTVNAQQTVAGNVTFDSGSSTTGTITLDHGLVSTLRFSIVPESSASTAQVVYLSGLSGTTIAGAGRLDQQNTSLFNASTLSGSYATMMRGGNNGALALGTVASAVGRFDLSANSISNGELGRGFDDSNFGDCAANSNIVATPTPAYTKFGGSYAASGVNGTTGNTIFTFTGVNMGGQNAGLANAVPAVSGLTLKFSAYIVDATRIVLIEIDNGGATGGYAFLGNAEQQTPSHTFTNGDLVTNQTYAALLQSNNGPGAGNVIHTPMISFSSGTIDELEYTGSLNGNQQYGLNSSGYYSMVQTNGLALAAFCDGSTDVTGTGKINILHVPMYFVSNQKAFLWAANASNLMTNPAAPAVADMVGELDQDTGAPFGGATETGFSNKPFAVSFEGVTGTFNNTHNPTGGISEIGSALFTKTGTTCVFFTNDGNPCNVNTNGIAEQTGTVTLTLDMANSSGTQSVTVNGTFLFNDDADGETDDDEGHGTLAFSTHPFQVPDHFVMISSNKVILLYCGTVNASPPACNSVTANVAGVALQH